MSRTAATHGYVYFALTAGAVKVGWTVRAPRARLAAIRTCSPAPVSLLAALPAVRSLEFSFHEWMEEWRIRGEWYEPNPVIQMALDVAAWVGFDEGEARGGQEEDECGMSYADVREVAKFARDLRPLFSWSRAPERLLIDGKAVEYE